MNKYLKMSDVFGGASVGVRSKAPSLIDCCGVLAANCLCPDTARYMAHAINSHDELAQMNQELLAVLEEVLLRGVAYPSAIEQDDYRMDFEKWAEKAREVINKARGEI